MKDRESLAPGPESLRRVTELQTLANDRLEKTLASKSRLRVLLDVDGVLGHFTLAARTWADARHSLRFTDEQITDYNIMKSFGLADPEWPSFISWLSETRFCREMPVYPGAKDFVASLRHLGEIVAVTTPFVGVSHWEADRRAWLNVHFGIGHDDVVFCKRKELVRGSILIDDKPANVEAFGGEAGQTGLLFTRPWNANHSGGYHVRVDSYRGALKTVRDWREAAGL